MLFHMIAFHTCIIWCVVAFLVSFYPKSRFWALFFCFTNLCVSSQQSCPPSLSKKFFFSPPPPPVRPMQLQDFTEALKQVWGLNLDSAEKYDLKRVMIQSYPPSSSSSIVPLITHTYTSYSIRNCIPTHLYLYTYHTHTRTYTQTTHHNPPNHPPTLIRSALQCHRRTWYTIWTGTNSLAFSRCEGGGGYETKKPKSTLLADNKRG